MTASDDDDDRWRDPTDYLEPLIGAPHSKPRIGSFRLGCEADPADRRLWVYTMRKRVQNAGKDSIHDTLEGREVRFVRDRLSFVA